MMTQLLTPLVLVPLVSGCRWIAYLGREEISGEELLLHPSHNLVEMATTVEEPRLDACPGSRSSKRFNASQFALRNVDDNLDGFGVTWYSDESDFARRVRSGEPIVSETGVPHELFRALFTASAPTFLTANNTCQSELQTSSLLKSKAIFAHVRAASSGLAQQTNAHPFTFNTLSFVHNGCIAAFDDDVKSIIDERHAESLKLVAGSTDSEYAGALFVEHLRGFPQGPHYPLQSLRNAMRRTLREISELTQMVTADASSLNFAVTDGKSLVVSRYRTSAIEDPPTLYFKPIRGDDSRIQAVVVASEPLDLDDLDDHTGLATWTLLGKDTMLSFNPDEGLTIECIDLGPNSSCDDNIPAAIAVPVYDHDGCGPRCGTGKSPRFSFRRTP